MQKVQRRLCTLHLTLQGVRCKTSFSPKQANSQTPGSMTCLNLANPASHCLPPCWQTDEQTASGIELPKQQRAPYIHMLIQNHFSASALSEVYVKGRTFAPQFGIQLPWRNRPWLEHMFAATVASGSSMCKSTQILELELELCVVGG